MLMIVVALLCLIFAITFRSWRIGLLLGALLILSHYSR
jgi:hypothetical protein